MSDAENFEELWSPDVVVGWRYWMPETPTWDFDEGKWYCKIRGVFQTWDARTKHALHLREEFGFFWPDTKPPDHVKAPSPGCPCGINAVKAIPANWFNTPKVIGRVHLAGVVDEYEQGYRAEKGEIVGDLYFVTDELPTRAVVEGIENQYGLTVHVQPLNGELAQHTKALYLERNPDGHWETDTSDNRRAGTLTFTGGTLSAFPWTVGGTIYGTSGALDPGPHSVGTFEATEERTSPGVRVWLVPLLSYVFGVGVGVLISGVL